MGLGKLVHTEWGSGDCKGIGGENVLVGGYNRVGVGPSFCSLHFSLLPWRAEMGRGSCHLTCECFKGSPGFFRKLPFSQPPTPLRPGYFSSRSSMEFLSHSQTQRRGFVDEEGGENQLWGGSRDLSGATWTSGYGANANTLWFLERARSDLHVNAAGVGRELWEFSWAVGIHCLHLGTPSHRRH